MGIVMKKLNQKGLNPVDALMYATIGICLLGVGISFHAATTEPPTQETVAVAPETNDEGDSSAKNPSTPAFDIDLDLTIPVSVIVIGGVAFASVKFVLPAIRSRRSTALALREKMIAREAGWKALRERKASIMLEWSKYETDVALMIDYPLMTNYADPVVSKVITAMQKMRTAEMTPTNTSETDASGSPLQTAVEEFEAAFRTAEKYARSRGQDYLSARDQKKLETARVALDIMFDRQAPAHEVQAAYKSLCSSLKGIIDIPQVAVAELESKVRKELVSL